MRRKADQLERMVVCNRTRGNVLAERLEIADTGATRAKGLLGRKQLAPGEGLWIVPCESVHTFGMQFAIDLIYLDRKHRIRKIRSDVRPWRISLCLSAHSVIELPAGTVLQSGSQIGDQLDLAVGVACVEIGSAPVHADQAEGPSRRGTGDEG